LKIEFRGGGVYFSAMRRCPIWLILLASFIAASSVQAATGRVYKVLPQLLDSRGRNSLSPSLYERDAYQFYLRQHTNQIYGMQFAVHWKAKDPGAGPLLLRVEARGVARGNLPTSVVIEKQVEPTTWIGRWTMLYLGPEDYKSLGTLTAWRATLWDGTRQIAEQKSFLW
jgi:hypothetical protein